MKIQFCCGANRLEGWENRDADADITKRLPYPDNYADMVFCEHGLEHVSPPDGLRFLIECYRILKLDGAIRICCPVLDRLGTDHARDIVWSHGHLSMFTSDSLMRFIEIAGFRDVVFTDRKECDSHYKAIGIDKDTLESCRIEGRK